MEQPTREGLVRVVRRWDLVALAVNAIIGAGIFGLPSEVFGRIGVYSLIAFAVCAVAVTLIIVCFAEVSSRFSDTGGPYLYAREAFGPLVGFEVGWLNWMARLTAFAANCNLLVAYASGFVPSAASGLGRTATICTVVAALTVVNVVGVRKAANVSNVLTVAKLGPLLLFVVAGCFFIDPRAYSPAAAPSFGAFSVSVLLLVYAFTGFEMAVIAGGEARDPRRDLPYALLIAIAVVTVFYMLIQLVAVGTFPGLAGSTRPIADAAGRFLGPRGALIMTAGALVSILGNLNVILLTASRLPFAMAERGALPRFMAATHRRFHTPHRAILVTAAVVLTLTLSGTFVYAVTISVIARLLAYAATCVALPVFRRRRDAPPALFVVRGGVPIAVVSLLLVAWLLSNVTAVQARDTGLAAALGLAIYWAGRARYDRGGEGRLEEPAP
jgi:APA family basic amino acid/polyamine antiporter